VVNAGHSRSANVQRGPLIGFTCKKVNLTTQVSKVGQADPTGPQQTETSLRAWRRPGSKIAVVFFHIQSRVTNPSMRVRDVRISLIYGYVRSMWLQTSSEVTANIRILGRSTVIWQNVKYEVGEVTAGSNLEVAHKLNSAY
jgi:hypothetical protein